VLSGSPGDAVVTAAYEHEGVWGDARLRDLVWGTLEGSGATLGPGDVVVSASTLVDIPAGESTVVGFGVFGASNREDLASAIELAQVRWSETCMNPLDVAVSSVVPSLLVISPNPSRGAVRLSLGAEFQEATAEVYDVRGRLVSDMPVVGSDAVWDGRARTGSPAAPGVYFVLVRDALGRKIETGRVRIVR